MHSGESESCNCCFETDRQRQKGEGGAGGSGGKAPRGQEEAGEWPRFTIRGLGHSPVIPPPQFGGTTE